MPLNILAGTHTPIRCLSLDSKTKVYRRPDQSIALRDGRRLAYSECGSSNGYPVIFFHGYPSSRLEPLFLSTIAARHDIRLIGPDRPGFGQSSPQPGRTILDWPDDVRELAQHLDLKRFAVIGGSGGGPYALACGLKLPRKMVSAVGLLASAAPWEAGPGIPIPEEYRNPFNSRPRRMLASLANHVPSTLEIMTDVMVGTARWLANTRYVQRQLDGWIEKNSDPDSKEEETIVEARNKLIELTSEAFAQGSKATVEEARLLTRDWGFKLEDLTDQRILIWHGKKDVNAPINLIRYMASRLQRVELKEYDLDHYQMGTVIEEVLVDLLTAAREERESITNGSKEDNAKTTRQGNS